MTGFGYTCLTSKCPRSFLFSIVANVGPSGASRPLAVAYRQGCDISKSPQSHAGHFVADTLAVIDTLSDPSNRAPLEAEKALAEAYYRSETNDTERPSIPDTPQPAFVVPDGRHRGEPKVQLQPELPWHDDTPTEFPFTTTRLLLGLLRDHGSNHHTRPSDVQVQPLSTVFRGDCAEYGLVILDISDLDRVKYGIIAFPVHYMAEVWYRGESIGWDPVEDPPPEREPDVVLASPRPRVPLSVNQWQSKYHFYIDDNPSVLRLKDRPLVDAATLDYIWPPELEDDSSDEDQAGSSSPGLISSISNYFWPPKSRAEDVSTITGSGFTTAASGFTTSREQRNEHINRAIDNLLLLTQPADLHLDEQTITNFQKLAEFREHLRRRLEEVPDSLGPSEASGHLLRIAYAGQAHLNWVAFRNLTPSVIITALTSDVLRGASALSLCVDQLQQEEDTRDIIGELGAALARFRRPVPDLVEVVGGLTEFLRETVPGIDISTWERQIDEAEKHLYARGASVEPGKRCIGVMAERSAQALINHIL